MTKPTAADRTRAAHAIAELVKLPIEFRSRQADIDALSLIIAAVRAEEREECDRAAEVRGATWALNNWAIKVHKYADPDSQSQENYARAVEIVDRARGAMQKGDQ